MSSFDTCKASLPSGSAEQLLECVANDLQSHDTAIISDMNLWFIILAGSIMFFMQAGFAVLCAGSVREKNVQNTMLKNMLDACGAAVGFWTVGYAFAYGGGGTDVNSTTTTFIGTSNFFLIGEVNYAFWFFQFAFAATSATIVAGTLAERCQMCAYMAYSLLLTGFVYPVVVHSIWSSEGFLSPYRADPLWGTGMLDYAGSGVVHTTGGMTAMIAVKILGPRKNRFHDARGNEIIPPRRIDGHSVPLQVLGTLILWFGWFGFNAGSAVGFVFTELRGPTASLAALGTAMGGAAGCVVSLFVSAFISERQTGESTFDIFYALNGLLAGLVSITAPCGVVEPWASFVIGAIAGLIYLRGSNMLVRFKIDDAVDAIPVHLANGIWGCIAVGLFASPRLVEEAYGLNEHVGLFYSGDGVLLGVQLIGVVFICGWVSVIMTPFFLVLNYTGYFRSDPLEEIVGLDISYHGAAKKQFSFEDDSSEIDRAMTEIDKRRQTDGGN